MEANTFPGWLSVFRFGRRRCWIVVVPLFVLEAMGGSVLAVQYSFQGLPELGGQISRADEVVRYPGSDRVIVGGRAVDDTGVSRAVIWELVQSEWMLAVLPSLDHDQSSWVMCIEPSPFAPIPDFRVVVGASQDATLITRAVLWDRVDPGAPWKITVLPGLDGRATGAGAEATSVGHPLTLPSGDGTTDFHPTVVGWSEDTLGTLKAVVWQHDETGVYVVLQLPDLSFGEMSRGNSLTYDEMDLMVVVGSAANGSQERRPVVWRESPFFEPFDPPRELTLCVGCTTGEVTAISRSPDPVNGWLLVGWGEDPGGNRQALLWRTDDNGKTYTRYDLGVPAGFVLSESFGAFQNDASLVVGQAKADFGAGTKAWQWSVNKEITDEPLSASVVDLPTNVTLRSATAMGPFENIAGLYTTTTNGTGLGAGNGLHAFVLTPVVEEIPTLSEWGMGVMILLLLSVGTLVVGRRRMVRAPAA